MPDADDKPATPSLADERRAGERMAREEVSAEANYRPGHEIARGGMGAVLSAHDQKLARSVAMKVMLRPNASPEERQRFQQEARVLGRLAHPNIVPVHDLGSDAQGRHFYTMKLVQGVTLHEVIGKLKAGDRETLAKCPLNALLTIFKKVCDAVAFAHSQGIIHRDLKPQNIMVGEFGEVLVMDWGLAKILPGSAAQAVVGAGLGAGPTGTIVVSPVTPAMPARPPSSANDLTLASGGAEAAPAPLIFSGQPDTPLTHLSSSQLTLDGTVMGTPNYMSPEQAAGRVAELDERSDIFSLGGVLYAILTLRPPVEGKDVNELLARVCRGDITPPILAAGKTSLPHLPDGRVPDALSAVTMKALRLAPEQRYRTVAELGRDIEAYQGGFATAAEQAGAFTQLRLFIQRHKGISVAATGVMLLTAMFILRLDRERALATRNADLAQRNELKATGEARRATAAEQVAKTNEQKASKIAELQRRENARARVLLADAAFLASDLPGLVKALDQCPEDLRNQTWEYLAAKRDASLGELKLGGFESPVAAVAVPGQPGQFALAAAGGDIGFVDAVRGELVRTVRTGRRGLRTLALSGNGRMLAVARAGSAEVDLLDAADGARRTTITLAREVLQLALDRDGTLLATRGNTPDSMTEAQGVDTRTGSVRWQRKGYFSHVLVHPDGDRVFVAGSGRQRQVLLLDAPDGRERARLETYVSCLALSPDGKVLAVGTQLGEAMLLNAATGAVQQRGRLHTGSVTGIAWAGDGHVLTLGSEGKFGDGRWVFRLWESELLAPRGTFFGLKHARFAPAWTLHPDTGDLLTLERPPRRWRIPVGRELVRLTHQSEQAWGGVFAAETILLARTGFELTRYDLGQPGRAVELPGARLTNATLAASHWASGQFALAQMVGGPPFLLRLYSGADGTAVEKLRRPLNALVNHLAFDESGGRIAVTQRDGALEVFSTADGRSLYRRTGKYEHAVFAGATNLFAIANHSNTVEKVDFRFVRLDAATGTPRAELRIDVPMNALAVSPDQRLFAGAGGDRYVYLMHTEPLPGGGIRERSFFRAHDGEIGALAFHPTQPILATASGDGSVKLWDYRDPKRPLDTFLGLGGMPVTLSFNPSGRLLMVDGQERTTRVYDVSHLTVGEISKPETPGAR